MDLKVSFVSYSYPYPSRGSYGGIERLVEGLSEALVRKGVEVSVITSHRGGEKDFEVTPRGVALFRARSIPKGIFAASAVSFSLTAFKKHLSLMRNSDIIHVFSCSLIPVRPIKNLLPPIVSYFTHLDRPESIKEFLYLPHVNFILYLLYKYSDIIVVGDSQDSPQVIELLEFLKASRDKIRFSYEGVDGCKFKAKIDGTDIKNKFGDNIVLYVGMLNHRKGLRYLVEAIPRIVKEIPDVKFVFVGKGDQEYYLKNLLVKLGVKEHVFFEGFVLESLLPQYYAAADVFAFPSLKEGYPLACLEAMACGTPVVATKLRNISTIVGDAGILVEERNPDQLAKGIVQLLKEPMLRKKLGEKAEKRVRENFTWDKVAEGMTKIYGEAMNPR
jgi:glycosyltransferase involved in cell wall biosynthesis